MKDFIYVAATNQSVAANSIVPITNVIRKPCCSSEELLNNGIILKKAGYYQIIINSTVTATAGTTSLQAYKNGQVMPTILASETTESGSIYNLSLNGVVRIYCGEQPAVITVMNTGIATQVNNLSIVVEYLG